MLAPRAQKRRSVGWRQRPTEIIGPRTTSWPGGTAKIVGSIARALGWPRRRAGVEPSASTVTAPQNSDVATTAAPARPAGLRILSAQSHGTRELQSERASGVHVNAAKPRAAQQRGDFLVACVKVMTGARE